MQIVELVSTPGHKYYLPFNEGCRDENEVHEQAGYVELSDKWVSAKDLKKGDKVVLASADSLTGKPKYGIVVNVKTEKLDEPIAVFNFEVADFHTYHVGKNGVCTHNANCGGLSNREMNALKKDILSGKDVNLASKDNALQLIDKKFSTFPKEIAGSRSAQGWHFDFHPINGSATSIEHINIYSKALNFRVHITWL